jgi:hypothetical protein
MQDLLSYLYKQWFSFQICKSLWRNFYCHWLGPKMKTWCSLHSLIITLSMLHYNHMNSFEFKDFIISSISICCEYKIYVGEDLGDFVNMIINLWLSQEQEFHDQLATNYLSYDMASLYILKLIIIIIIIKKSSCKWWLNASNDGFPRRALRNLMLSGVSDEKYEAPVIYWNCQEKIR